MYLGGRLSWSPSCSASLESGHLGPAALGAACGVGRQARDGAKVLVDRALLPVGHLAEHRPRHDLQKVRTMRPGHHRRRIVEVGPDTQDLEELFERQPARTSGGIRREIPGHDDRPEDRQASPKMAIWIAGLRETQMRIPGGGVLGVAVAARAVTLRVHDIASKTDERRVLSLEIQRHGGDGVPNLDLARFAGVLAGAGRTLTSVDARGHRGDECTGEYGEQHIALHLDLSFHSVGGTGWGVAA